MANQIRLKRASGSDPTASDLVLGEPAVRTDTGELFFLKDNGNVAKVSGGGVSDGDKGDITISNSGDTFTIDDAAVTRTKLNLVSTSSNPGLEVKGDGTTDGYLQLNCSQNSHGIKLKSPAHSASQSYTLTFPSSIVNNGALLTDTNGNLSTSLIGTSNISNNAVTLAKLVDINVNQIIGRLSSGSGDPEALNPSQIRSIINVENGATADQTASEILSLISTQTITANGLIMTDNKSILLGASDDFRIRHTGAHSEITDEGTGDLRIGSNRTIIADASLSTNQARFIQNGAVELYHSGTKRIETTSSGASVSGNITVSGTVDGRDLATDGSKLDGIASGATNVTNTNQLTNGAGFITATLTNEQVQDIVGGMVSSNTESGITVTYQDSDGTLDFSVASQTDQNFTTALKNKLDNIAAGATNVTNNNQLTNGAGYITSAALAGASDGGNAALLDGIDSTQFVRADQDDTLAGVITFSATGRDCINLSGAASDDNRGIAFNGRIALSADQNDGYLRLNNSSEFSNGVYTPGVIRADSGIRVHDGSSVINVINTSAQVLANRLTGALPAIDGSALTDIDADTLDGQQGSYYLDYGNLTNVPSISSFPSGTRMIFQQTSAPTGWTKDTSNTNQRALRVVSGTAGSGGSVDFTNAFASKSVSGSVANTTQGGSIANGGNNTNSGGNNTNNATSGGNVNNHTLSTGRMPSHRHDGGAKGIHDAANGQYGTNARGNTRYPLVRFDALNGYANYDTYWTSNAGSTQAHSHSFSGSSHSHSINSHSHSINAHSHSFSGSAHNHSFSGTAINLAVLYLDVIIAQKD